MRCPPSKTRFLAIGDSYMVGLGPNFAKLASSCGIPVHHHGIVGAPTSKWASNQVGSSGDTLLNDHIAAADRPNVALISLGGNDFGRMDPKNVAGAIRRLKNNLLYKNIVPLWIMPPTTPFADKIGVRDMIKAELGDFAFDSRSLDISRVESDPLKHPDGPGYRAWAAGVWPWVVDMLEGSPPAGHGDQTSPKGRTGSMLNIVVAVTAAGVMWWLVKRR